MKRLFGYAQIQSLRHQMISHIAWQAQFEDNCAKFLSESVCYQLGALIVDLHLGQTLFSSLTTFPLSFYAILYLFLIIIKILENTLFFVSLFQHRLGAIVDSGLEI